MAGRTRWRDVRAKMPAERRAKQDAAGRAALEEMLLSEIRRLAGMTQVELAGALDVTQATVSKMENADDIQVSTLRRLVEALGGNLEIIVNLPHARITLSQFDDAA